MISNFLCMALLAMSMHNHELVCDYSEAIIEASELYNINPFVIVSMGHHESRWEADRVSSADACGVLQIIPTWSSPRRTCEELKDIHTSILQAAKHLRYWLDRADGDYKLALCGYNAGNICFHTDKHRGFTYARVVMRYSRRIKKNYERFRKNGHKEDRVCIRL